MSNPVEASRRSESAPRTTTCSARADSRPRRPQGPEEHAPRIPRPGFKGRYDRLPWSRSVVCTPTPIHARGDRGPRFAHSYVTRDSLIRMSLEELLVATIAPTD